MKHPPKNRWRSLAWSLPLFFGLNHAVNAQVAAPSCIVLNPYNADGSVNNYLYVDYATPGDATYFMEPAHTWVNTNCLTFCFQDCSIAAVEGNIDGTPFNFFSGYNVSITSPSYPSFLIDDSDFPTTSGDYCFTLPGAGTFTVVVTEADGDPFMTTTITVHPSLIVDPINVQLEPDEVCSCDELDSQFPEAVINYTDYFAVHWQLNDGENEYKDDDCHHFNPGSYIYTVAALDGCGGNHYTLDTFTILPPTATFDAHRINCTDVEVDPLYKCFDGVAVSNYVWNWGDGTFTSGSGASNPPPHTYTTAGNHTIILTVSWPGGSSSDTVVVNTLTAVPAVVNAPENSCSTVQAVVQQAGGGGSFASVTYSIISGTATITPVPPVPGVYNITGIGGTDLIVEYTYVDANGCTGKIKDTIEVCCQSYPTVTSTVYRTNANAPGTLTGYLGTALWPGTVAGTTAITGRTIYVYDDLTLNKGTNISPFVFTNCTILVYPGKKMSIANTNHIKFVGCTIKNMCNEMWDGIYIPNPSTMLTSENTKYEQALNAVVSNSGGYFYVYSSVASASQFINCWQGIVINPYNGAHVGRVFGTKFTSTTGALLPPHSGAGSRTYQGIYAMGSPTSFTGSIVIGDALNPSRKNEFNNLTFGLYSIYYDLDNFNCTYTNMVTGAAPPLWSGCDYGTGVCAIGSKYISTDIQIGGSAANQLCTFSNCYNGIQTKTYVEVLAQRNEFNTMTKYGIDCWNNQTKTITIKENKFNTYDIGVHCELNYQANITIDTNHFNHAGTTTGNTGILIEEITPKAFNAQVVDNVIKMNKKGVWMRNTQRSGFMTIARNEIRVSDAVPGVSNLVYGIRLENTTGLLVELNSVYKGVSAIATIPSPSAPLAPYLFGVTTEMSSSAMVRLNDFFKMGRGVYILNNCNSSYYVCNDFTRTFTGFYLSNAIIPTQYTAGGDQKNRWYSPLAPATSFRLEGNAITGGGITWYRTTGTNYTDMPRNTTGISYLLPTAGSFSPCNQAIPPPGEEDEGGEQLREANAGDMINGEREYLTDSTEYKHWDEKQVYEYLTQSEDVVNLGVSTDADYQDYVTSMKNTETGKANKVNELIAAGDLDSATVVNSSRVAETVLDENSIWLNALYLQCLDGYVLTGGDSTTLTELAYTDPLKGGEAVYSARVWLKLDPTEGMETRSTLSPEEMEELQAATTGFKVYPNPTSNQLTVEFEEAPENSRLMVVDITGKMLIDLVPQQFNQLDVKALPDGLYLLLIRKDGQTLNERKFIIQH